MSERRFDNIPPVNPELKEALDKLHDKPKDPTCSFTTEEINRILGRGDNANVNKPNPDTDKYVVRVYIDNGVCFEYDVFGAHKAREHATAIVNGGYRHNDGKGEFEHYPPHRILKVKVAGVIPTLYPDRVSGT